MPLVVDPVMVASSGAELLEADAVDGARRAALPARDGGHAEPATRRSRSPARDGTRRELAERLHELGAPAVIVTGGHGEPPVDHLFDGARARRDPGRAPRAGATHGAGCTHSATLAALLARGLSLEAAAARRGRAPRRRPSGTASPSSAPATARSTSST